MMLDPSVSQGSQIQRERSLKRHAVLQSNTISIHSTHSDRSRKELQNGSVYSHLDAISYLPNSAIFVSGIMHP